VAKGVPADQCSTGEQKALLISLILANARALAADLGRAPVLLLDEVAAHLDPESAGQRFMTKSAPWARRR
jgi:DNA replication and repair protein RecF